ncbi:unnamed protein product [Caenorhabditis bovis]|uniref:Uncharacterized protein n=1 Tax=Caenorhabditis bovis TaxID=2654633 RepID=A0A8S1F190_9PELO|nr:unnamed protein product [Caenorhabditis bovis]
MTANCNANIENELEILRITCTTPQHLHQIYTLCMEKTSTILENHSFELENFWKNRDVWKSEKLLEKHAVVWRKLAERLEFINSIVGDADDLRELRDSIRRVPYRIPYLEHAYHVFNRAIEIVKHEFFLEMQRFNELDKQLTLLNRMEKNRAINKEIKLVNKKIEMRNKINELIELYEAIIDLVCSPTIEPEANAYHPIFVNLQNLADVIRNSNVQLINNPQQEKNREMKYLENPQVKIFEIYDFNEKLIIEMAHNGMYSDHQESIRCVQIKKKTINEVAEKNRELKMILRYCKYREICRDQVDGVMQSSRKKIRVLRNEYSLNLMKLNNMRKIYEDMKRTAANSKEELLTKHQTLHLQMELIGAHSLHLAELQNGIELHNVR